MGKYPARGYTYSLPDEKTEEKKRKTKPGKQAILNVCSVPCDLNVILPRSTCRTTAECDYFCFRKILKEIFPIPSAGTDILRNVSFGCFCTLLEAVLLSTPKKLFKFSTVFK